MRVMPSRRKARHTTMMLALMPRSQMLSHLFERGVGLIPDELAEPLQAGVVEHRRPAAAMGPGLERAGPATELEQPCDARDIDPEAPGDLPARAFMVVDRGDDPVSKVLG